MSSNSSTSTLDRYCSASSSSSFSNAETYTQIHHLLWTGKTLNWRTLYLGCNLQTANRSTQGCPSDMRLMDLPVRHYFLAVLDSKYTINVNISAFPSDMCLNFLPVHLYFYLSRTGGQSIISIPATSLSTVPFFA